GGGGGVGVDRGVAELKRDGRRGRGQANGVDVGVAPVGADAQAVVSGDEWHAPVGAGFEAVGPGQAAAAEQVVADEHGDLLGGAGGVGELEQVVAGFRHVDGEFARVGVVDKTGDPGAAGAVGVFVHDAGAA